MYIMYYDSRALRDPHIMADVLMRLIMRVLGDSSHMMDYESIMRASPQRLILRVFADSSHDGI